MSLIKRGSLFDLSVKAKPQIVQEMDSLKEITTFRELVQVTRKSKPISFDLVTSPEERGLALKSVCLNKSFEGFLGNFTKSNLYAFSIAWDLSNKPIFYFPDPLSEKNQNMFTIGAGQTIEFHERGLPLYPKCKVNGGIAYKIMLLESDQNAINFSSFISAISDTVKRSELSYLLGLFSTATGVNGASILLISEAAKRLYSAIGDILKANSDDFIDYVEGYYPMTNWVRDFDDIENHHSTVVINRF
jgi:hypothetical protein